MGIWGWITDDTQADQGGEELNIISGTMIRNKECPWWEGEDEDARHRTSGTYKRED